MTFFYVTTILQPKWFGFQQICFQLLAAQQSVEPDCIEDVGQPVSAEQISMCQKHSPLGVFSNASDYCQALLLLDKRITFYDKEPARLSKTNSKLFYQYVSLLLHAVHKIEGELITRYSISKTFSEIKIGSDEGQNNAWVNKGDFVRFQFAVPEEFDSFFISPGSTYAHELGHYLIIFDENGQRSVEVEDCVDLMTGKKLKSLLTTEGKLRRRYFRDIPFNLLPNKLLFPVGGDKAPSPFTAVIGELIANKIALQLAGFEESKKRVISRLQKQAKDVEYPWQVLHLYILAKKYNLDEYCHILEGKLTAASVYWTDVTQTDQLVKAMLAFFEEVSLKVQP